jgi:RNA polymerase sigma-70 factor (ECF subfamily)
MPSTTHELLPTRQSLLDRLKNYDDSASWKDFFDTYWKLIYGVARKSGLSDSEAQDVVQETVISVAKHMAEFNYDPALGSFKNWLMRMTKWRITDQWRKKVYQDRSRWLPREEPMPDSVLDLQAVQPAFNLEQAWEEEWQANLLAAALAKAKRRVSPEQFQLFDLHVLQNMDAREVARRLRVKLPAVYYAKYKISAMLRRELRRLEDQML